MKRSPLLYVFLFFFLNSAIAGDWIQKASFGGVARHRASGCATTNKGYMGLGHMNGTGINILYNDWWEYDPASNSWTQKANYPVGNYAAISFTVNEQPHVGGGVSLVGQFYRFNPQANTWTATTPCPFFDPTDSQGFSINNKGYVYKNNQLAEYDPQLDAWTLKTNAPINFTNWSCCFAIEGSGFVKQGLLLYEYKASENTWIQRANFPGVTTGGSSGFAINQKGFVTCGYVGGLAVLTQQAWYFSPGTNTWTAAEDFPGTSRRFPVAFAIHDKGYFGTGTNGVNFNDFWQYNPVDDVSSLSELDAQVSFFPNPTSDFLNIKFAGFQEELTYEFINLSGQIMLKGNCSSNNSMIDVKSLPRGSYILSLRKEDSFLFSDQILLL